MGRTRNRQAGQGQLDVIFDNGLGEDEVREYDNLIDVHVVHRCEMCDTKISADESQAYGIGYDCAAKLGREVWAARRAERRAAEAGRSHDAEESDDK